MQFNYHRFTDYTGQPVLASTPVKSCRILSEQSFTARMLLLMATREKTQDFSSVVLPTPSLYHL